MQKGKEILYFPDIFLTFLCYSMRNAPGVDIGRKSRGCTSKTRNAQNKQLDIRSPFLITDAPDAEPGRSRVWGSLAV